MRILSLPSACFAFLCLTMAASTAEAQDSTKPTIDVNIFQPSPGATSFFTTESGDVNSKYGLSAGLNLNYARKPLAIRIIRTDSTQQDVGAVVNSRFDANLMGAIGLFDLGNFAGDIGLVVPFVAQGGFQADAISGAGITPDAFPASANDINKFTLGDIRLIPKVRVLSAMNGRLSVAVFANIILPTGSADFAKENGPVYAPAIAISGKNRLLRGAFNFGYRIRDNTVFSTLRVDDEFFAKAALALNLGAALNKQTPIELIGEVFGQTPADKPFGGGSGVQGEFEKSRTTAEADIGVRVNLFDRLLLTFGGGGGLTRGYGAPAPRIFASAMWYTGTLGLQDADKDGIPDNVDGCPDKPEDKDGFEDSDGCPEVDNDKDDVLDEDDQCPNEPEGVHDGFRDEDGCPDPDNDNDGLLDANDKCPNDPEDKDGYQDDDGCPDLDNDNDGILDIEDKCPNEAEDKDGYMDFDGCPEADNDGDGLADLNDLCPNSPEDKDGVADDDGCPEDNDRDGIPDDQDKCPNEAEIYNGIQDEDGCPEKNAKSLVNVTDEKIEIKESVQFTTGSAKISKKSFPLLDQVASVLKNYKHIKKVRVEGHTDNKGPKKANIQLSQQRAAAVRAYLVGKGIDSSRLSSEGYGPNKPIAPNTTAKGRETNRRVDFIITELKPIGKDVTDDQPKPPAPPAGDAGFEIELPGGGKVDSAPAPAPAPAPATPAPKSDSKKDKKKGKEAPKSDAPLELNF